MRRQPIATLTFRFLPAHPVQTDTLKDSPYPCAGVGRTGAKNVPVTKRRMLDHGIPRSLE